MIRPHLNIYRYGSSYLLTNCSFQLFYGRIYTFFNPKNVFLAALVIFEVGSAICGAAPSSIALIVGRAIAGLGASGLFAGAVVILVNSIPLYKRPIYTGFVGAFFGIASVIGPLLGGALTAKASWRFVYNSILKLWTRKLSTITRYCFFINLPIGSITFIIIVLMLKLNIPEQPRLSTKDKVEKMDPIGTSCFLPGMVCLLLALQWGGTTYAWNNGRVIVLLVLAFVLLVTFIIVQVWKKDNATVPPRIFTQGSIGFGFLYTACVGGSLLLAIYYLQVWFQAIKGADPIRSDIMMTPLILALGVATIFAGLAVTKSGYYTPFMYANSVIMSLGAGLITTFKTDTSHSAWIGYQIILGVGIGLGLQQGTLAAQTVLARNDVPTGVSVMLFGQSFGGAFLLSVGQNVLATHLISGVSNIPGLDPALISHTGVTDRCGVG